ncbi:hypothetical protein N9M66_00340 [Litoreibacter sp.]|nr:hypothetical protein [Litoreibacter sp.]
MNIDTDDFSLDDLMGMYGAIGMAAGRDGRYADELAEDARETAHAEFYARAAESPSDVLVKLIALHGDSISDHGNFAAQVYREALPHLPRFAAAHLRECFARHDIQISEDDNAMESDQMSDADRTSTLERLQDHATANKVTAPTVLLACSGAPSTEVLDYCATHGLTLDWVFLGEAPQHRPEVTDIGPGAPSNAVMRTLYQLQNLPEPIRQVFVRGIQRFANGETNSTIARDMGFEFDQLPD